MDRTTTNSEAEAYRACTRRWKHAYIDLRRSIKIAAPLAFGHLVHAALEAWWGFSIENRFTRSGDLARLERSLGALQGAWEQIAERTELDEFGYAVARELVGAYHLRWLPELDEWEVLAVEHQFSTRLPDPLAGLRPLALFQTGGPTPAGFLTVSGKYDAVLRRRADGLDVLLEHKTSGGDLSAGGVYWERLRLDSQPATYLDTWNADHPERPATAVVYDVLARPKLRPYQATPEERRRMTKGAPCKLCARRKGKTPRSDCQVCAGSGWEIPPALYANQRAEAETLDEFTDRVRATIAENPDKYFGRAEVTRRPEELIEARAELAMTRRGMKDAVRINVFPRDHRSCFTGNQVCPYFPVCTGAASIDDDGLYRTASTPHEELADELEPEECEPESA